MLGIGEGGHGGRGDGWGVHCCVDVVPAPRLVLWLTFVVWRICSCLIDLLGSRCHRRTIRSLAAMLSPYGRTFQGTDNVMLMSCSEGMSTEQQS